MTAPRLLVLWPIVAMALLLFAASTSAAADPRLEALSQARAAANAGDSQGAVRLYDRLLELEPDDVEALRESAQQLSWSKRYDAAIERYDRVLVLDPTDRFALLERAKVLGWGRRYEEAVSAFDTLLRAYPDDLDGRLGRARVLSWSGQLGPAREAYLAILDDHPAQPEALLGVAQTFAWSGELHEARLRYEEATRVKGDFKDAEIGIAYLDIWQGTPGKALDTARRLDNRYPGDDDVRALLRSARSATAPWLAAGWDRLDDADDNTIETLGFEGSMWLPLGTRSRITYKRYDLTSGDQQGAIHSLQAHGEWMPRAGHRLDAMIGVDTFERRGPSIPNVTDLGLSYRFPVRRSLDGWIAARREPYRYSVPLIDNRIVVDSYAAGVSGRVADHWYLSGEASAWRTSDGNRRSAVDLSGRHRWPRGTQTFEAGGNLRWLDWREEPDSGYFSPSGFTSAGALGRAFGSLPAGARLDYDVYLEAGLQSYEYRGRRTSSDPYYVFVARLGWDLSDAARVELTGEAGSYASQGASDWRYTRAGARFVWRFGVAP